MNNGKKKKKFSFTSDTFCVKLHAEPIRDTDEAVAQSSTFATKEVPFFFWRSFISHSTKQPCSLSSH